MMSAANATPSPWWPENSSEQHYNYSSTSNGTALSDRNVNATGNTTKMSLSMMPPPQHSFDESIISIIILFASILSVSMCCLLICRVSMWSEQRRRNAMVAEQHEGNSLGVALSVLEGLETGSYKEIVGNKPPRCVTEAELKGSGDCGTCEQQQQQQVAMPAHNTGVDGDVQHQEQKHKEQLEGHGGEEEETCTVCLCEFADDAAVRLLPCGHFFHTECVDCWLQKNATCPTCRWSLLTEDQMSAAAAAAAAASSGGADTRAWAHQRHSPQQMQSISIEAAAGSSTRPRAQEAPSHSRSLVQALGDILTAILISEHGTLA